MRYLRELERQLMTALIVVTGTSKCRRRFNDRGRSMRP